MKRETENKSQNAHHHRRKKKKRKRGGRTAKIIITIKNASSHQHCRRTTTRTSSSSLLSSSSPVAAECLSIWTSCPPLNIFSWHFFPSHSWSNPKVSFAFPLYNFRFAFHCFFCLVLAKFCASPKYKRLCLQMQNYENHGKSFLNACRVSHRTFTTFLLLLSSPFQLLLLSSLLLLLVMLMAVERRWSFLSAVALFQVIISLVQNGTWKKCWKSNARLDDDSWTLENDLNWFWFCTTGYRDSSHHLGNFFLLDILHLKKVESIWKQEIRK